MRRWRMVGLFLLAYWLYIDGVDTIVRMAVDYGLALGSRRMTSCWRCCSPNLSAFQPPWASASWENGRGTPRHFARHWRVYPHGRLGVLHQPALELYALAAAIGLVQGGSSP